jgi:hypothetical protein
LIKARQKRDQARRPHIALLPRQAVAILRQLHDSAIKSGFSTGLLIEKS